MKYGSIWNIKPEPVTFSCPAGCESGTSKASQMFVDSEGVSAIVGAPAPNVAKSWFSAPGSVADPFATYLPPPVVSVNSSEASVTVRFTVTRTFRITTTHVLPLVGWGS